MMWGPYAALKEAHEINLLSELKALRRINADSEKKDPFQVGRELLFDGLVDLIRFDPHTADIKDVMTVDDTRRYEAVVEKIKAGGHALFNSGGHRDMHDPLVWLFIPKRLQRDVDVHWDGIGEWDTWRGLQMRIIDVQ